MRIEILHWRDPDEGCEVDVWVDGVKVPRSDVVMEDVDPGRGYSRSDWEEVTDDIRVSSDYSEAFRTAAIAARDESARYSRYIEDDTEDRRAELAEAEATFAAQGGRGVDLAERIDWLRRWLAGEEAADG